MGNCGGGGNKQPANRDTLHKKPQFGEEHISNEIKMKCCMAGDVGVGKSLFYHTFFKTLDKFTNMTTSASGDNNCTKVKSNKGDVSLSIWDTAGQERFMSITKIFYKGAEGIIVLYDVTKKSTFSRIATFWLEELKKEIDFDKTVIMIVGNKCDLPNREVTQEEAQAFAKSRNLLFKEVSALKNQGIEEAIKAIVDTINSKRPSVN